jgi:large exoprotein involved in heme utilization and adhesion
LFNTGLNSDTFQNGKAGDLTIDTKQLIVRDGAVVSTRTFGEGQGGNLTVKNSDSVEIINDGSLETSAVNPTDTGTLLFANAGNLTIGTKKLIVHNAAIGTSTFTGGKGGELVLNASDSVNVIGSFVSADTFSQGDAGSLTIDTKELIVRDGSLVSVSGFGEGNPGKLELKARSVSVTNGAVISASTAGQKDAGSIEINATEDVRISGDSGLATVSLSSGKGGNINIQQARSLFLMDGAQITSQSLGTGAAGDISIHTRENLESDRSQITATTQSGDGGNITLTVGDLLLMRNNSQISTTAGNAQAGGNGGNITINAPFLVAVPIENSDIKADAFTGAGGTVNITFAGIYGLEFRARPTLKSDITASSEYGPQGTFEVSDLTGIKAEQGLTNLPTEPVDRSRQITQKCRSGGATAREKNQFIITGRGGLPPSPNEPLQSEAATTHWVTLDSDIDNKTTPATTPPSSTPKQLVEAQGWIVDDNGQIVLTTQAPTVTPQGEWFFAADCNMPQAANTPQG